MTDRRKPWKALVKEPRRIRSVLAELSQVRSEIEAERDPASYLSELSWVLLADYRRERLERLLRKQDELIARLGALYAPLPWHILYENTHFEQACSVIVPDLSIVNQELLQFLDKHPDYLHELHWRAMEELVALLLKEQGWATELGPGSGDGGVDIRLVQKSSVGELLVLVQVKRWRTERKVGLEAVAALSALVDAEHANKGVLVTTSEFLPGARKWADGLGHRLLLAGPTQLVEWIRRTVRKER